MLKKWLSYREYALLGRPLAAEAALNANYQAVRADTYPWPRAERERA